MEAKPSLTLILTQEELLQALHGDQASVLFEEAIRQGTLLDNGFVSEDGTIVTRTIVGPPDVMRQIFPTLVQIETP